MKQTAVEWLMPKILELTLQLSLRKISARNCELEIANLFEQAKEMDKEQITDSYIMGSYDMAEKKFRPEQYYTETYKSK